MNGERFFNQVGGFWRIVNWIKSAGFVGGIVGLIFGPILVIWGLELWLLLPESSFRQFLTAHAKDELVFIGLFILCLGIGILLDLSGLRMSILLRSMNRAEMLGVDVRFITAARVIILSRRLGGEVNAVDLVFASFLQWLEVEQRLNSKTQVNLKKAWSIFRHLPQKAPDIKPIPTKKNSNK